MVFNSGFKGLIVFLLKIRTVNTSILGILNMTAS